MFDVNISWCSAILFCQSETESETPTLFPMFLIKLYNPDALVISLSSISDSVIVFNGKKKNASAPPVRNLVSAI